MKRFLTLVVFAVFAGTFLAGPAVEAKKKNYDEGDLDGEYYYVYMQQRVEGGVLEHCSGYGTLEFYGDGTAALVAPAFDRCDGVTDPAEPHGFTYTVDADGGFVLEEDGGGELTHCQILDKGRIILCDGAPRGPETYSWIAIGIQR